MLSRGPRFTSLLGAVAWMALIGCASPEEPSSPWVEFRPRHPPYRTAEQSEVVVLRLRARSSRAAIEQRILERADELERMLQGLSAEDLSDGARRRALERQIRDVFSGLGREIQATDLYIQPLPAEPDMELLETLRKSDADA